MGRVVVIGERARVAGFALAGAEVCIAEAPEAVLAAWAALGQDVAVVVLTASARAVLGDRTDAPPRPGQPLTAVMPA